LNQAVFLLNADISKITVTYLIAKADITYQLRLWQWNKIRNIRNKHAFNGFGFLLFVEKHSPFQVFRTKLLIALTLVFSKFSKNISGSPTPMAN